MPQILLPEPLDFGPALFVKLGEGSRWADECFAKGILRIGYGTENPTVFDRCVFGDWNGLRDIYSKQNQKKPGYRVNQVRQIFEDQGKTLWITFHRQLLWWTFLQPGSQAVRSPDNDGAYRHTRFPWSSRNLQDRDLHKSDLSGHLTRVEGFRGTISRIRDEAYIARKINGQPDPDAADAVKLSAALQECIVRMMKKLTFKDFELLVDLVFSSSGWRRLGQVGGNQKLVDMELLLPTTGERAFVQVKAETSQSEFEAEYRDAFAKMASIDRMFYVYHTGVVHGTDGKITIIGPEPLSKLVQEAGLVSWLTRRI